MPPQIDSILGSSLKQMEMLLIHYSLLIERFLIRMTYNLALHIYDEESVGA